MITLKIKRILSALLAVLIVSLMAVPAFAEDAATAGDYDYLNDERLTKVSNYNSGEFVWGGYSPAMYQIVTKTMFTLDNLPSKMDGSVETKLQDMVSITPEYEGVSIEALYVFKCPTCGKAVGGSTIQSIYAGNNQGLCSHCGAKLPDPSTVKIYRFITIPSKSDHYAILQYHDFTKAADDIYGATENLYGDGKDLPQSDLVYSTDEKTGNLVLSDFYTSGSHVEFKSGFKSNLFLFLVNFQYTVAPWTTKLAASQYNAVVQQIRLFFLHINEKVMTWLVTF